MKRLILFCLVLLSPVFGEERAPAVAGSFYEGDSVRLGRLLDEWIQKAHPPVGVGQVRAVLAPHAGHDFSGAVAVEALKAAGGPWETIVMVGSGHYVPVRGAAVYQGDAFRTPLGSVPIDKGLSKKLLDTSPLFEASVSAHLKEHSIEVLLPMVQRLWPKASLVALVMNTEDRDTAIEIGHQLARAMKGRRTLLVISSDLSHYPSADIAKRVDATTLLAFTRLEAPFFWQTSRTLMARDEKGLQCTYCGEGAVIAGLVAAQDLGANDARVLRYLNSGSVPGIGDPARTVGYAAALLQTVKKPAALEPLSGVQERELLKLARAELLSATAGTAYRPMMLSPTPSLNLPAAVFVTLTRNGNLRGCIGTLEARDTLLESVRRYTRAAALEDSRFKPVTSEEARELKIEISILTPMRPIANASVIQKGDGVTVEKNGHTGVFLPDVWKELPDKKQFLEELCQQKAGLPRDCAGDPTTRWKVFGSRILNEL